MKIDLYIVIAIALAFLLDPLYRWYSGMSDQRKGAVKVTLKLLVVLGCWLLASHWDYEDSQRIRSAEYVARVAHR
jgi:predicted PurR-regulated permease PerM